MLRKSNEGQKNRLGTIGRIMAACAVALCAHAALAQTNAEWRDSLTTLSRQIELNPKSVDLRLRKAAVNLQLQQWEYAIEEYNTVLLDQPQNTAALYFRAYANNNLRRYDLAKNDYEDILKRSPSHLEARLGLAYTLILMGRAAEALEQMNVTVEQHPDSAVAYAARAGLEKDMKLYDTALYDWEETIRLSPESTDYIVSKADILILMGRKAEAEALLDDTVRRGTPRGALREWYKKCK